MPEIPDFEQIADRILSDPANAQPPNARIQWLAGELRQVWNARGAADIAAYQAQYRHEYVEDILVEDVIQKLDR